VAVLGLTVWSPWGAQLAPPPPVLPRIVNDDCERLIAFREMEFLFLQSRSQGSNLKAKTSFLKAKAFKQTARAEIEIRSTSDHRLTQC